MRGSLVYLRIVLLNRAYLCASVAISNARGMFIIKKRENKGAAGYHSLEDHFIDVIILQQKTTAKII